MSGVFTGAVTYRVVQVTPNEDGQPQLVAGLPSNQASIPALLQFFTRVTHKIL